MMLAELVVKGFTVSDSDLEIWKLLFKIGALAGLILFLIVMFFKGSKSKSSESEDERMSSLDDY